MERKRLGNVDVCVTEEQEVLHVVEQVIRRKEQVTLYYLNAHCFNLAQGDEEYRRILNEADLLLNDGIGVELGAKMNGFSFPENLNGTDLTPKLLHLAAEKGFSVYLLGAERQVIEKAVAQIARKWPTLHVVGYRDGFFAADDPAVVQEVNRLQPDLLIVGMGVPRQEKWISRHRAALNAHVITGVGAFFDFTSGNVRRAPRFVRAVKMEWAFRLLLEPKRLWRRYIIGNVAFFYHVVKAKKRQEANDG